MMTVNYLINLPISKKIIITYVSARRGTIIYILNYHCGKSKKIFFNKT